MALKIGGDYPLHDMFKDKKTFKEFFEDFINFTYAKSLKDSSLAEKYVVLSKMIMAYSSVIWQKSKYAVREKQSKTLYYFSLEFLLGRMLSNNLLSLGIYDVVKDTFDDLGIDINEIEDMEVDAGLGNGGLGRLASCFLDSLSSLNYAGNGNCIRYENGLFKQVIRDNKQVEVPDQWLRLGYPWETRKTEKSVDIKFYGDILYYKDEKGKLKFKHINAETVLAVPYDVPIIGSNNSAITTLRLWKAEPSEDLPVDRPYIDYLNDVTKICLNLYPEDYNEEGKIVRIKQEYFFVAAGLKSIITEHLRVYKTLDNLSDKVVIQLNDTHPTFAIPELMRLLIDEYEYSWDNAWNIVTKVFAYTNHTVLQEALEKWPIDYIKKVLPRIYLIIEEIDRQFIEYLRGIGKSDEFINSIRIINDGTVRMAYLCIIASFSVNGVAKLHSNILIEGIFKNFYEIFPNKFNNKTNGITHRRWLLYSNPQLSDLISKKINVDLSKDFNKIELLEKYADDPKLQEDFLAVKKHKKIELKNYLMKLYDIELDENSIFDVQAKRLHAYKRQLLNVMYIISLYKEIKNNLNYDKPKITFIFAAKAAGNYYFAKKVIELINCISDVIDNDEIVSRYIKVVFIPNYRVTIAEKLMPASDISEQISTAGKEASGTGNMKFMMNGALTLGTMDGANVEIYDLVGEDNIVIFGKSSDEIASLKGKYNAKDYYNNDSEIKSIIDSFTDGTWTKDNEAFIDLRNEFLERNDEYYLLADYKSYKEAHEKIYDLYKDKNTWAKKCLINIAKSSYFSSDRTIEEYVKDIWHLDKIK